MTNGLRWGILGTGGIAASQTSDLQLDGHAVTAVGSRTQASADAFAARFGIPRAHGSYEELVADPEVDAIYVATPHPFHAANARLALEAGKHVLVEKPFTLNAREAEEIVALAEERGLVLLEAMWTRYLPHMIRIREIIAAGTIGEVRTLTVDHTQKLPSDPEHRIQNLALGGGALLDLGIYPISFAWDLFGAPSVVHAISTPSATGADAETSVILGYPGGQQAVTLTQSDGRGPNRAAVIGTEGWIEIDPVWYNATGFTVFNGRRDVVERYENTVPGRGMQFQARALERIVASGSLTGEELPPRESVAIMGTLDEVRRQIGLVYPGE